MYLYSYTMILNFLELSSMNDMESNENDTSVRNASFKGLEFSTYGYVHIL